MYSRVNASLESTEVKLCSKLTVFTTELAAEQDSFNAAWRLIAEAVPDFYAALVFTLLFRLLSQLPS